MIGGLSILGTLSLVAAGVVARRPPVDEEAARRAVHEKRYAEWISQGSIPMWVGNHHISLDALEDVIGSTESDEVSFDDDEDVWRQL